MGRGGANNYTSGNKCGLLSGQFPWVRTAEMKTDIWIHHITLTAGCVYGRDLLRLQILHVLLSTRRSGTKHQASAKALWWYSRCLSRTHTLMHTHRQHSQVQTILGISHLKKTFSVLFSVHVNVWFKNEVGGNAVIFTFSQICFQARARDSSAIQV